MEPLNNGHIGDEHFVHCREVVHSSECPLSEVPLYISPQPVSRSTSELPQLVGVRQQPGGADPTATTENREMTAVDQSKPGQKSSKPSAPAKMDKTSTKQDQRSTTIAVKQYQIQSTQDQQLSSSQEKLDTPGRTEGTEEEERAAEEEEKETLTEYSTIEEKSSPAIVIEKVPFSIS